MPRNQIQCLKTNGCYESKEVVLDLSRSIFLRIAKKTERNDVLDIKDDIAFHLDCLREFYYESMKLKSISEAKWLYNGLLQSAIKGVLFALGQRLKDFAKSYKKPQEEYQQLLHELSSNCPDLVRKVTSKSGRKVIMTVFEDARIRIGHQFGEIQQRRGHDASDAYHVFEEIMPMELELILRLSDTFQLIFNELPNKEETNKEEILPSYTT